MIQATAPTTSAAIPMLGLIQSVGVGPVFSLTIAGAAGGDDRNDDAKPIVGGSVGSDDADDATEDRQDTASNGTFLPPIVVDIAPAWVRPTPADPQVIGDAKKAVASVAGRTAYSTLSTFTDTKTSAPLAVAPLSTAPLSTAPLSTAPATDPTSVTLPPAAEPLHVDGKVGKTIANVIGLTTRFPPATLLPEANTSDPLAVALLSTAPSTDPASVMLPSMQEPLHVDGKVGKTIANVTGLTTRFPHATLLPDTSTSDPIVAASLATLATVNIGVAVAEASAQLDASMPVLPPTATSGKIDRVSSQPELPLANASLPSDTVAQRITEQSPVRVATLAPARFLSSPPPTPLQSSAPTVAADPSAPASDAPFAVWAESEGAGDDVRRELATASGQVRIVRDTDAPMERRIPVVPLTLGADTVGQPEPTLGTASISQPAVPMTPKDVRPVSIDRDVDTALSDSSTTVVRRPVGRNPVATTAPIVTTSADAAAKVVAGTTAPAFQVFGAMLAAKRREDRAVPSFDMAAAGAVATVGSATHVIAATADAQQSSLDMTDGRWPHAMIDRIEVLRDAADATDTHIRLVPDALGSIDVSVRRDGDTVHVHFAAEQAATRALIQDAQPRLAGIAQERGLSLGQTTVDGGTAGQQQRQPAPEPRFAAAPPRAATVDDTDPTETGRLA